MLTVAGIINATGVTLFLMPVSLYDSGISGTSMLLAQVFEVIPLSVFLLVINVPLFIYGTKKQGLRFTIYAIYVVAIYSIASFLYSDVLPVDLTNGSPIAGKDLLLCTVFGGFLSGVGSGLAIRYGGAMDGIEVLGVVLSKKLGVTVGTFVFVYSCILYVICGTLNSFGLLTSAGEASGWALPLYSIITYFLGSKVVDVIVTGVNRSKSAIIVTKSPQEITDALMDAFGSGVTLVDAKGGFSGEDKTMIYFVVNSFQIEKMRKIIQEIDSSAYISISDVAEIFSARGHK